VKALKQQSIIPRIDGITRDLVRLRELAQQPLAAAQESMGANYPLMKLK